MLILHNFFVRYFLIGISRILQYFVSEFERHLVITFLVPNVELVPIDVSQLYVEFTVAVFGDDIFVFSGPCLDVEVATFHVGGTAE